MNLNSPEAIDGRKEIANIEVAESFIFCLTAGPSPIGEGSASAWLYGSLPNEAHCFGFPIMP